MKEKLVVNDNEKQLLNQRNLIETVFDCLKHKLLEKQMPVIAHSYKTPN